MEPGEGHHHADRRKSGLKEDLLINARRRVLLADSSKYGSWSLFCATPLQSLTDIITDELLGEQEVKALSGQPFTLTLAKP